MDNIIVFGLVFVSLWAVTATWYAGEVSNNAAVRSEPVPAAQSAASASEFETGPRQLKEVLPEREMRELAAQLAAQMAAQIAEVRQQLQEEHAGNEQQAADMKAELARLKQAAPEREKAEKPMRELAAQMAEVRQQLQEEHAGNERQAANMKAELARLQQAPPEREKAEKAMRELAAQLAAQMAAQMAEVRQQLKEEERTTPRQPPAAEKPPAAEAAQADRGPSKASSTTIAIGTSAEQQAGTAADSADTARLLARATLLLSQGNVGTARRFLELAAEKGSASAIFALAETYDPAVLAAWGTLGTQGDPAKARDLYRKALAGGVQEASDRLKSLHGGDR